MKRYTTAMHAFWRAYGVDCVWILLAVILILAPGSGFKSMVIWLGFLFVVVRAIQRGERARIGATAYFVLLYLLVCGVSAILSVDVRFSVRQWVKLLESIVVFGLMMHVLGQPARLARGLRQFGLAIGMIAVVDALRFLSGALAGTLELVDGRWFASLLGYPTIAAGMYSVGLVVLVTNAIRDKSLVQRAIWSVGGLAIFVLLYWLQTRSVLLGLLAGTCVFISLAPLSARLRMGLVAGITGIMMLFVLLPGTFRERVASGSLSERQNLWSDAALVLSRGAAAQPYRAWVGFGYGHRMFERLHADLSRQERQTIRVYDHAHNVWVESRIQSGWMGTMAFGGLLLAMIALGLRHRPPRDDWNSRIHFAGMSASLTVILVYAQFSLFFAHLPALLFWTLLGAFGATFRRNAT